MAHVVSFLVVKLLNYWYLFLCCTHSSSVVKMSALFNTDDITENSYRYITQCIPTFTQANVDTN